MANSLAISESLQQQQQQQLQQRHACRVGVYGDDDEAVWPGFAMDIRLEELPPAASPLLLGGSCAKSPTTAAAAAYSAQQQQHHRQQQQQQLHNSSDDSQLAKGNDATRTPSTMAVAIKLEAAGNWLLSPSSPLEASASGTLTRNSQFAADDNLQSVLSREMELDENFENFYELDHANSLAQMHNGTKAVKLEPIDKNCSLSNGNSQTDSVQVDIYRDLILRHLIQDIRSTCSKLNLPTDPMLWDSEDCVRWIEEMCTQFQLTIPPRSAYRHSLASAVGRTGGAGGGGSGGGRALLAMSVEDFCACVGEDGGDTLHAQLQLWKTAFESYNISPKYCQSTAAPQIALSNNANCQQYPLNMLNTNTLSTQQHCQPAACEPKEEEEEEEEVEGQLAVHLPPPPPPPLSQHHHNHNHHHAFTPPFSCASSSAAASMISAASANCLYPPKSAANKMRKLNLELQSYVTINSAAKFKYSHRSSPSDLSSNSSCVSADVESNEDDFCHYAPLFEMPTISSLANSQMIIYHQQKRNDISQCAPLSHHASYNKPAGIGHPIRQIGGNYSQQFAFFEQNEKVHQQFIEQQHHHHHHSSNNNNNQNANNFIYTNSLLNANEIANNNNNNNNTIIHGANLNLNFVDDFKLSNLAYASGHTESVFVEANTNNNNNNNNNNSPPNLTASAANDNASSGAAALIGGGGSSGTIHLWHFIRELLDQPREYGSCVRWVNRDEGTFKIESSHHLARFWGLRKNRSQMNYDKLSRSLRQYYKKGIIQKPEKKQRLVYKFLPPYNL